MDDLKQLAARHRTQAGASGVAVVALVAAVTLGMKAHGRLPVARADLGRYTAQSAEIANFKQAFRNTSDSETARVTAVMDSLSPTVPRDLRVELVEQVSAAAEHDGLREVRVRIAGADSSGAVARADLAAANVAMANYTLSVECTGTLSGVLTLVSQLPPSVALQSLHAGRIMRGGSGAAYRLTLGVFETAGGAQHG